MITKKQQKWINHLSDVDKIKIIPFDPTAEDKFQTVKQKIQGFLGHNIPVLHRGASSLGISGQDGIDVYIPVPPSQFDLLIEPLKKIFGNPTSKYPQERVHFVTIIDGKHIDVFLINNSERQRRKTVKISSRNLFPLTPFPCNLSFPKSY